jgi:4'-phosphopantetheinyl transferase
MTPCPWQTACSPQVLAQDEVHIWRVDADAQAGRLHHYRAVLSADERAKAQRFRFVADRVRYIVRRGVLRTLLGQYLGSEPGRLRFRYGPHGKPFLNGELNRAGLRFNLSHSKGKVLYAITLDRELGIDIERIRTDADTQGVARRWFSPREASAMQDLAPELQRRAFFAGWTRKEAYLKARGEGLTYPLHVFEVTVRPDEPVVLLGNAQDPTEIHRWRLADIPMGPGYAAAMVVEGHAWVPKYWHWIATEAGLGVSASGVL